MEPEDLHPSARVTYALGQTPLDRALLWLGVGVIFVGIWIDSGWAALAGVFFLGWTGARRLLEYRRVAVFNQPGRPVGTLDDDGFVQ